MNKTNKNGNNIFGGIHIMAIDCCEHILSKLESILTAKLTALKSTNDLHLEVDDNIDLIVIGITKYPIRRMFIGHLRRVYPETPMLILRREEVETRKGKDNIRGEFLLSDRQCSDDCHIVAVLRNVLPLSQCAHTERGGNFDVVREIVDVIVNNYSHPELDLNRVANSLSMSPAKLSRILNQQVGISFRQLLRRTRIEEAKRMLTYGQFSVKEVAARVGFTDSHYFSRSFKELTGFNASEYKVQSAILN